MLQVSQQQDDDDDDDEQKKIMRYGCMHAFDEDCDGWISTNESMLAMRASGIIQTDSELLESFREADISDRGEI